MDWNLLWLAFAVGGGCLTLALASLNANTFFQVIGTKTPIKKSVKPSLFFLVGFFATITLGVLAFQLA